MKSLQIKYIILSFIISTTFLSCIDMEPQEFIYEISIQMIMPQEFGDTVAYAGQLVTLNSNRNSYQASTDSTGKVTFKNIIPGIYNISTH